MCKFLKTIKHFLLDLLFPIECLNCQLEGDYFCNTCFQKIKFNSASDLLKLTSNLCAPELNQIFIAGDYEDQLLQNLIIKYKYNFLSSLSRTLGRFLMEFWRLENQEIATLNFKISQATNNYLVIPVPLAKKRLRWRGFNQAELLAREFSAYFNYGLNLDLKRIKYRCPQADLNESERIMNIQSAFTWTGGDLKGQTILLIDDVITTGATLNEAAKVLKAAGATQIDVLVLAKG